MDLTQAIAMIKAGSIDAQENPLSNTVTYGVHKFHGFHTLTGHFYVSRPIFVNRTVFDAWPDDLKAAMQDAIRAAIAFQRELHVQEEKDAREAIIAAGCEITELTVEEHNEFAAIVAPLRNEAAHAFAENLIELTTAGAP
jgi:TRAP-type transport system periplasmic protein